MRIADIRQGERARKDMGDIAGLAKSIQEHGMLHPVVVLEDGTLVAGGRRIAAAGMLGMEEVPVTVVNVADLLSAERDENEVRKDLTPSEAVALGKLIEEQHRAASAPARHVQRVNAGLKRQGMAQIPAPASQEVPAGPSADVAAAALGMSPASYQRAKRVVLAAEADPSLADIVEKMDQTGGIAQAEDEIKRRKSGVNGRSEVHYKAQYPKPNREMERGLIALDGLVTGFGLIELDGLDRSKTGEWAKALNRAASSLQRIARKVRSLHG